MNDCPPSLRGDLSKWLCEINTGVYVGQVSSRVREALWNRVCQNLRHGRATMVYTTNTEQKMAFRVHNTNWVPVDYDGITLMRRPLPQTVQPSEAVQPGFSKAAKRQMVQRINKAKNKKAEGFVVLDLETTGLQPARDEIVEMAAIRATGSTIVDTFSCLVRCERSLPQSIVQLTGITEAMLREQGIPQRQAVQQLVAFLGEDPLVGYNIGFDMEFLRAACEQLHISPPVNRCVDVLGLARRKVFGVKDYKLTTLAEHFSLPLQDPHRAREDCERILALYCKLKGLTENQKMK